MKSNLMYAVICIALSGCAGIRNPASHNAFVTSEFTKSFEISPELLQMLKAECYRSELNHIRAIRRRIEKNENLAEYVERIEKGIEEQADNDDQLLREIFKYFIEGDHLFFYEIQSPNRNEDGWIVVGRDHREKHRIKVTWTR